MSSLLQTIGAIQSATLKARDRLSDNTITTRAEAGRAQVVRVTFDGKGKSTVTPVSEWMPAADAAAHLDAMR